MRFVHILAMTIAAWAIATAFFGWNGAVLVVALAVPVLILLFVASEASESGRRVHLYDLLWNLARVAATFVGLALAGWLGAVGLFLAVLFLEVIARALRTLHNTDVHSKPSDPE
jgi:hypothetical protein